MRLKYLISIFATDIIRNSSNVNASAYDPLCDDIDGSSSDVCAEGYLCKKGEKDYASMGFPESVKLFDHGLGRQDEYCDCAEENIEPGIGKFGMTGQVCDTVFQKCPDKTVCFHGASCQKGAVNNYFCDCSTAFYPSGKKYVGKNCQYEARECDDLDIESHPDFEKYDLSIEGKWLCANGSCRNSATSPVSTCACRPGFDGHHCEFQGTAPKCELDCDNNGICKIGVKNFDSLSPALQEYFDLQDEGHDAHCICPTGFTGQQCETRVIKCGDAECLNGSKCKSSLDGDLNEQDFCDCGEIPGPQMYAGNSCESVSTSFCDSPIGSDPNFCTNKGICPVNIWDTCVCPVDYSGPRCEFLVQHHKECVLPCKNGGNCFHGSSSLFGMHCKCPDGFTGDLCADEKKTSIGSKIKSTATVIAKLAMWIHIVIFFVGVLIFLIYVFYGYWYKASHKHDPIDTIPEDEVLHDVDIT